MNYLKTYLLFILLGFVVILSANNPREAYMNADLEERVFDKKEWQELTKDLDYSDDREPWKPEEVEPKKYRQSSEFSGLFKALAIILAIAIAVLVIFHLMGTENLFAPKNKKIKTEPTEINIEEIEENIHETELENFIKKAIQNQEYAVAIRLYYLEVLKELSLKKVIKWKKDKTNGEYLRELRGSSFHSSFRELTAVFERIWYGKLEVGQEQFESVKPKFQELINRISNHN